MPHADFGSVLAAQALYGVLQYVVDNGPALHGARLAANERLDTQARAGLIGVRLVLAVTAAVVSVAVGFAGGTRSLLAVAPFTAAYVLFALLAYWEPFGRGRSEPWSSYVILRALGPAVLACAFLAIGARLPVYAAGAAECVAIVIVALLFRLRPRVGVHAVLSAPERPWRSVIALGAPSVLWPTALGSGTVVLNATGNAPAAAVLAVAIRLVTGVSQLAGIVGTSVFPRLARREGMQDVSRVTLSALASVLFVASSAAAILLVWPAAFVTAFLARSSSEAEATAILALSSSAAVGIMIVLTMVLAARGHEVLLARPYVIGTGIVIVGSAAVALARPAREALAMAAAFVVGETAGALVLARAAETEGGLGRGVSVRAAFASGLAALGTIAALWSPARGPMAFVFGLAALTSIAVLVRGARGESAPTASPPSAPSVEPRA